MKTLASPIQTFIKKGDVTLLILSLIASGFGLALIYSATRWEGSIRSVVIQLIAIVIGVVIYILCTLVDFQLFVEKKWRWLFIFNVVLMLLILTPLGTSVGGNRNWLSIEGFPVNIQPNEVVKIPFILLLALQITKIKQRDLDISAPSSVLQLGGHTAFMLGLIAVICGDMGMCVVYLFIFITMAWSAGVKLRWFLSAFCVAVLFFLILWAFILPDIDAWNDNYLIMRFRVLFDHSLDPQNVGYQQTRSIMAIGSGQIFGKGFLKGTMTQSTSQSTLPARDTDFIFSVCGEELGMVGCLAILLILGLIVLRCIWVAIQAKSPFYSYTVMGMAGMLLIQIAINIGMCLYIFPVMGLTLPFFSYGGSSIITLYAAMGVVSSAKAHTLPSWLRDPSPVTL